MAVAQWGTIGPKDFPPPKVATLRHWYKAAKKVIKELPEWQDTFADAVAVDEQVIIFNHLVLQKPLIIARKRNLR